MEEQNLWSEVKTKNEADDFLEMRLESNLLAYREFCGKLGMSQLNIEQSLIQVLVKPLAPFDIYPIFSDELDG